MKNLVDEVFKELLKRLGIKTALVIGATKSDFENSYVTVTQEQDAEYDCIIIRELDNSMLARLALGDVPGEEEKLILKALCEKKEVFVVRSGIEYLKSKNTIPGALYRRYCDYEKILVDYGAKIVGAGRVITRKLIEEELGCGRVSIKISKDSIITPLAMDFIQERGISVERR